MSDFKIKRGMVFYLERPAESQPVKCVSSFAPEKKRPYMVISNDKCNEYSQLLNIAPIYTREASSDRWYQVPFKSTCNRDCVVDVGAIMLVPKELLNENSYSAAVTQYTIANSVLLEAIGRAIHRQFDVSEDIHERIMTPTVQAIPSQGITLNININGTAVTPKVSAENNNVTIDFVGSSVSNSENTVCNDKYITNSVSSIKENSGSIAKSVITKESKSSFRKLKLARYEPTSKKDRKYMEKVIRENYKLFGGTMSYQKIANELGVSLSTIQRIGSKLLATNKNKQQIKKSSKRNKYIMTRNEELEFVNDMKKHGAKWCLEKYKSFGFTKVSQVYRKERTIKERDLRYSVNR